MRIYCSYHTYTPTKWKLERSYKREGINVPKEFSWDGVSIPRAFHFVLPKWGTYSGAALIHDFLYSKQSVIYDIDRKTADKLFLKYMKEDGVGFFRRRSMYYSVRVFGGIAWKKR